MFVLGWPCAVDKALKSNYLATVLFTDVAVANLFALDEHCVRLSLLKTLEICLETVFLSRYTSPPPTHNKVRGVCWTHRVRLPFCLSFRVSELCPEVTSWTDQPFVTNFVMVVHHRDQPFVTNFVMVVHHRESIVMRKKWVATFKWKPQWWLILSKYDCFCCIIWTTGSSEPFVIKRGMVVHHKCHAKKFACYPQGQGHWTHIIKILLFLLSSELNIVLPNVVGWHIIISRSVMWRNCFAVFKVKVIAKVENFVECLSGRCLLNYLTFVAKHSMVMHHHEPQCLVGRLCCYQC